MHVDEDDIDVVPFGSVASMTANVIEYRGSPLLNGTGHLYRLTVDNGRRYDLGERYSEIDLLGKSLVQRVTSAQIRAASKRISSGETVAFGKYGVSLKGLAYQGKFVPWSQITKTRVSNGSFSIHLDGRWLAWGSGSIAAVPNSLALLMIVDMLRDLHKPGARPATPSE